MVEFETIAGETKEFIKKRFSIEDDEDFTLDANLFDGGFIDSMDATEVIVFLEERYGIEITQKDIILYPMNTINEIAEVVWKKLG